MAENERKKYTDFVEKMKESSEKPFSKPEPEKFDVDANEVEELTEEIRKKIQQS